MAAINLLLGQPKFKTTIGVMKLDAATSITHENGATVSKNPIEDGSDVTDNVRLDNRSLSIDGMISESPLLLLNSALNVFTGAATSVGETAFGGFAAQALSAGLGSIAGVIASRNQEDVLYPDKAFQYLKELRQNRIPFNIQTRLEVYENMILTRLTVPQRAEDGKSLRFQATFEQIQIVQTRNIILPERNTKNQPGATKSQNLGKQPRNEASGSNQTVAFSILDRFRGN